MGPDPIRSSGERADTPLTAAIMAGRWIRTAAVDDEHGRRWRANPDPHGRPAAPGGPGGPASLHSASLNSGAAGIVLFFLELAAGTGHEAYLEDARAGARYLAATWRRQADVSLHHGLAGVVLALTEAGWVLGEERFEAAAVAAADRIVRGARAMDDGGIGWSGDPTPRGDGGVVLGLLRAAAALGVPAYEEMAIEAGRRIARLTAPRERPAACPALPAEAAPPGFLAGTAGTAFLLARLYGATGEESFLDAARRGAGLVRAAGVTTGRGVLVGDHLGYCSGSAGIARMFYELYRVTGDSGDLEWVKRLARGVRESGAPFRQTAGLWNVACQCCGTAGLIELYVGLWAATGEQEHLEFARRLADHLIGRATGYDGRGYRWYQAYRRHRPGEVTADTGYLTGAAGIGAALLHLDAAGQADRPRRVILLPDNPFPPIPVPAVALRRPAG
ncbi:lanthionine synthetase LanC family protein [Microbispora sp. NPDC004025]